MFVEKELVKLIHPSLYGEDDSCGRLASQISRCAHIALLCVQEDPADRPSMWDVALMLNDGARKDDLPIPKKPSRLYGSVPRFADWLREDDEREWYNKKTVTVVMRSR